MIECGERNSKWDRWREKRLKTKLYRNETEKKILSPFTHPHDVHSSLERKGRFRIISWVIFASQIQWCNGDWSFQSLKNEHKTIIKVVYMSHALYSKSNHRFMTWTVKNMMLFTDYLTDSELVTTVMDWISFVLGNDLFILILWTSSFKISYSK